MLLDNLDNINNIDNIERYYFDNDNIKSHLIDEFIENQINLVEKLLLIIHNTNAYHKLRTVFKFAKKLIHKKNEILITI